MRFAKTFVALPTILLVTTVGTANATPTYDQTDTNVTSDVIFGSGNANGAFTVSRSNGVEIGLRGKLRFDETNSPQNTFNSNGDGSYTFQAGTPPTGFGFDANSPTTPVWNFEWSVNTDYTGATGNVLSDFNYFLTLDVDPGPGVVNQGSGSTFFDPINLDYADHAIGDNSTQNGEGSVAADPAAYANLIDANNLAQNSWSYEFFNSEVGDPTFGFDPTVNGIYTIGLTAISKTDFSKRTSTTIDVEVASVPEPGTLALFGLGLTGMFVARRRKA